ncbi:MAG: cupin domain-containing protein [Cyanobacteria bacterium Co-bin13]|nr:cupin domain-containing protein [Cyanobacteria bacterium Co-bin13]
MTLKLFSLQTPVLEDLRQDEYPILLRTWRGEPLPLNDAGTHFGFVFQGQAYLQRGESSPDCRYPLQAGMFFGLPGSGTLSGENSSGLVITCLYHRGLFSLGGPIEAAGRLAYINGGTNSVLIAPPMLGDPCLHGMYLPPNIQQTLHTHPSYRIGIVVEGSGNVETPQAVTALQPGDSFLITANEVHRFCTGNDGLTAVMFHPDSDVGFTHRDNPMLRRTLVDGVSAVYLPQIHSPTAE